MFASIPTLIRLSNIPAMPSSKLPPGGAETINFSQVDDVYEALTGRTPERRGADSCIDAAGCEAAGHGGADAVLDKIKAATLLAKDRVHVLRQVIMSCRGQNSHRCHDE